MAPPKEINNGVRYVLGASGVGVHIVRPTFGGERKWSKEKGLEHEWTGDKSCDAGASPRGTAIGARMGRRVRRALRSWRATQSSGTRPGTSGMARWLAPWYGLARTARLARTALLVRPAMGRPTLLRYHCRRRRPWHHRNRGCPRRCSTAPGSQSLLVLGRSVRRPRLLGLLLLAATGSTSQSARGGRPRGKAARRWGVARIRCVATDVPQPGLARRLAIGDASRRLCLLRHCIHLSNVHDGAARQTIRLAHSMIARRSTNCSAREIARRR
jgi:hypothetical protein